MILKAHDQDLDVGPLELDTKTFKLLVSSSTATMAIDCTGKSYRTIRTGCLCLVWAAEGFVPEVEAIECS